MIDQRRNRRAGFSLVELMVVILILGILGSFAAIKLAGKGDQARVAKALNDISVMEKAIELFRIAKGRLPNSLDEIADEIDGGVPDDPWGNEYLYQMKSKSSYDIICFGSDGDEGGEEYEADLNRASLKKKKKE